MIQPGDVIKHKRSMDVAFQVITSTTDPDTGNILLNGVWLNQGQCETYSLGFIEDVVIRKEHLGDWLKCAKPNSNHIRNEQWSEL